MILRILACNTTTTNEFGGQKLEFGKLWNLESARGLFGTLQNF
jgi:hypothetical protein